MSSSFGVDHKTPKHVFGPVINLDLTCKANQDLLLQWIESPMCIFVHAAPPCGTSSRAREIDAGPFAPEPLRTAKYPDGVPSLNSINADKVASANILYEFTTRLFIRCCELDTLCMVENPASSWMWCTSFWAMVPDRLQHVILLHMCMFGSKRNKKTKLVANTPIFDPMNRLCDNSHQHASWGRVEDPAHPGQYVWATSLEREYTSEFCHAVADLLIQYLVKCGVQAPPQVLCALDSGVTFEHAKVQTGTVSKASKLPPLVPHYRLVVTLTGQSAMFPASWKPGFKLTHDFFVPDSVAAQPAVHLVPHHSKILRLSVKGGDGGQTQEECSSIFDKRSSAFDEHLRDGDLSIFDKPSGEGIVSFAIGIFWTPCEFIREACEKGHPRNVFNVIPHDLRDAVNFCEESEPHAVASFRALTLKHWILRARDLSAEEKAMKDGLHGPLQRILSAKRVLLFRDMLSASGYPDKSLACEFQKGFSLHGPIPKSNVFAKRFRPGVLSAEELCANSTKIQQAVLSMVRQSDDVELDRAVWHDTLQECAAGWADGPFEVSTLPCDCAPSRRFGIRQSTKIRLIDDFSCSSVNATATMEEKPDLHGIDHVACLSLEFTKNSRRENQDPLLIRTVDLKSAYKQVPLAEDGKQRAVVIVWSPEHLRPMWIRLHVLPFGATHSVMAFLRLAHAMWYVGVVLFRLTWTHFYDDFVTFSRTSLQQCTGSTVECLLDLLGWNFDRTGKKATPFARACAILGVMLNLDSSPEGSISLSNTNARKQELGLLLDKVISAGTLSPALALQLRGRLGFAENQVMGRVGVLLMRKLTEHAYTSKTSRLSGDFIHALQMLKLRVVTGEPRRLHVTSHECWLVFTDASYEPESDNAAGLGGVLVDPRGNVVAWYSSTVPVSTLNNIGHGRKGQIIFELELIAVWMAYKAWDKFLSQRHCIFFVDNQATKAALASGTTAVKWAQQCLCDLLQMEFTCQCIPWYSWLATESNPADAPSRFEHEPWLSEDLKTPVIGQWFVQLESLSSGGG